MRFTFFLTLLIFLSHYTMAQQTVEKEWLNELNGYKYKHFTINADSSDNGIPIIIGLHWRGSAPHEFEPFLRERDSLGNLIKVFL